MNTNRPCGCKGVRSCLQCEKEFRIDKPSLEFELQGPYKPWSFCIKCNCFRPGWSTEQINCSNCLNEINDNKGLHIPGLHITENFLTSEECKNLVHNMDNKVAWCISQSGRRKQNFGPKTNFKKQKLKLGSFRGFPDFTEFVQVRFRTQIPILKDFFTIEQCSLEYDPEKGASIDPHIDDCWIWGERVVTVNCLGDSFLTLTPFSMAITNNAEFLATSKYNLNCLTEYKEKLLAPLWSAEQMNDVFDKVLRIPMPT